MSSLPPRLLLAALLAPALALAAAGAADTGAAAPPPPADTADASSPAMDAISNSVVKIYSTVTRPDVSKPWASLPPQDEVESGVVIEGHRILTNAHDVLYSKQVLVKAGEGDDKLSATVVAFSPGLDLAILKLDDDTFFQTHPPVRLWGELPHTREMVSIIGYPADATNLSAVKITVTHIDFAPYGGGASGLRIRLNSEVAAGVSGGAIVSGDHLIGVACRHGSGNNAFSFGIPTEEILPFINSPAAGLYPRKHGSYVETQHLENAGLRAFLGLDPSVHGVVVPSTADLPVTHGATQLDKWDVITEAANEKVDDQGQVPLPGNGRVGFRYLYQSPGLTTSIPVSLLRAGKPVNVDLALEPSRPTLIPEPDGTSPSYFILGPVVFSAASSHLMALLAGSPELEAALCYRGSPLATRRTDHPAFPGEELVFIASPFFPHNLAIGYSNPVLETVKAVNGIAIKNLAHLVQVLHDSKDEFVVIEFAERESETLVFPRKAMIAATDDILNDNGVRSQGSPDMMAIWNK